MDNAEAEKVEVGKVNENVDCLIPVQVGDWKERYVLRWSNKLDESDDLYSVITVKEYAVYRVVLVPVNRLGEQAVKWEHEALVPKHQDKVIEEIQDVLLSRILKSGLTA